MSPSSFPSDFRDRSDVTTLEYYPRGQFEENPPRDRRTHGNLGSTPGSRARAALLKPDSPVASQEYHNEVFRSLATPEYSAKPSPSQLTVRLLGKCWQNADAGNFDLIQAQKVSLPAQSPQHVRDL